MRAIIVEAARSDANISAVARRRGIKPSLLFRWRRMAREGQTRTTAVFSPITLPLPSAGGRGLLPEAGGLELGVDMCTLERVLDLLSANRKQECGVPEAKTIIQIPTNVCVCSAIVSSLDCKGPSSNRSQREDQKI